MRVKTKPLPPPKRWRERDDESEKTGSEEELEMRDLVTQQEHKDDDYYFEDPSNIGRPPLAIDQTDTLTVWCGPVTGRNDIPEADFPAHVRQMHLDRDKKLELEYKVPPHSLSLHDLSGVCVCVCLVTGQAAPASV